MGASTPNKSVMKTFLEKKLLLSMWGMSAWVRDKVLLTFRLLITLLGFKLAQFTVRIGL